MVSTTDTFHLDDDDTVTIPRAAASPTPADRPVTIYYLAWRIKPTHPWRSEEFFSRFDAHCEYFARMQRGMEVFLEVRRRNAK
jgi:hypothetical protein